MASYNRVVLIGNLTRDPEYRQLPSGQAVCRLGLAVNRQFKNRQTGSNVQEVCFIDIDVWGAQAESCKQYLQKGRPVLVEGRLKFDTWEDQQGGGTRSKHSIVADRVVFLGTGASAVDEDGIEISSSMSSEKNGLDASIPAEKELMDQLEQIKNRARSSESKITGARKEVSAPKKSSSVSKTDGTESLNFKDEQPFQDDLPF